MANTKLINPKSEVLSVFKKTPLVQIVDSEKVGFSIDTLYKYFYNY